MIGPLPYIGGKNRLAQQIISRFPDHQTYAEPFAGGAQVFFRKEPSPVEVLNDLDGEIVNFLRVCQWHSSELVRHLQFTVASRRVFETLLATNPVGLTDVQRAARFFYLQKNSFGGRVLRQNFHYAVVQKSNFNPLALERTFQRTHERLARVQIESLPYEEILKKYDRPKTLFYLDPPYFGRELYRFNFTEADFRRLRDRLSEIRGRFVLSLNDTLEVRRIFRSFRVERLNVAYSSHRKSGRRFREVLIYG